MLDGCELSECYAETGLHKFNDTTSTDFLLIHWRHDSLTKAATKDSGKKKNNSWIVLFKQKPKGGQEEQRVSLKEAHDILSVTFQMFNAVCVTGTMHLWKINATPLNIKLANIFLENKQKNSLDDSGDQEVLLCSSGKWNISISFFRVLEEYSAWW